MHVLAPHPERLAAGRQDVHPRGGVADPLHRGGYRVNQVLAIVEHEQQLLFADVAQHDRHGVVGLDDDAERARDGRRQQRGIPQRAEVHEADLAREAPQQCVADLDGQRRLAHARRTDDGEEPRGRHAIDE